MISILVSPEILEAKEMSEEDVAIKIKEILAIDRIAADVKVYDDHIYSVYEKMSESETKILEAVRKAIDEGVAEGKEELESYKTRFETLKQLLN